ncbi:MAG TPA: hypothetical protein VKC63_12920 [Solirubrobacterales bacterium]|nr:hypothetical protein [Solirubrobacterales bacterium]
MVVATMRMVVDRDEAIAARGDSGDAPLSAAPVDRFISMLFPDHAVYLVSIQFALGQAFLPVRGPDESFDSRRVVAMRLAK